MAGSNRGAIVVVLIGAVIAAGLATFYLAFWAPKRAKQEAAGEVERFSHKWQTLRGCLVGPAPMSGDMGEAIILRELTARDAGSLFAACESDLKAAGREGAFRSGDDALEKRWDEYRVGRAQLAKALAHRTAKRPKRSVGALRRRLADGARAAEAGYLALRKQAGLNAPEVGKMLSSGERRPLTSSMKATSIGQIEVQNNRVTAIDTESEPRRLAIIGNDGEQLFTLRRGVNVAAAPAPGWGVSFVEDEMSTVELGADGEPGGIAVAKFRGSVLLAGALGDGAGRRVVVTTDAAVPGFAIAYSSAAGEPYKETKHRLSPSRLIPVSDLSLAFGRLTLQNGGETLEWNAREPLTPTRIASEGYPCYAARASWWLGEFGMTRIEGGVSGAVAGSEEMPWMVRACSDSQAIGAQTSRRGEEVAVRLCSQSSCPVATKLPLAGDGEVYVLLAPSRGPLIATVASGVILIWAPDDAGKGLTPGTAINIGEAELIGLVEWKDELAGVIRDGERIELAVIE